MEDKRAYKACVLMHEFSQKMLGAGTRQEKTKSLIANYFLMSDRVDNLGKSMIAKYLELSFKELKSAKLVIDRIKKDQDLLLSILDKKQINELFQQCVTATK